MYRALLLICTLLLGACADQALIPAQIPHVKLPIQLQVHREQDGQHQDWLVSATKRHHGLHWSLTDRSGTPLAQQDQDNDGWKKGDEVALDYEARDLFSAVLFALTSDKELRFDYPDVQVQPHGRSMYERWTVTYSAGGIIHIALPGGPNYIVSPLNGKAKQ
jgi:hypothetical protein